ncbi:MAG: hypothetical protein SGJ24_02270 [Chloroflexota bacterium]|nr:hypothetical protein [Chloroflexota bacterium]
MKRMIMTVMALAMLAIGVFSVSAQQNDEPRQTPLVCDAFTDRADTDRISYYMGEGIANYYAGLYERAEDSFSCIVEQIDDDYAPGYTARGQVYMAQRDYVEASEDYGSAINLDGNLFGAYNNRGIARASRGLNDEALEDFAAAIAAASDYRPARINRAVLNATLENYESAIADLEQAITESGIDDVLTELERPDRPSDAPRPGYEPIDAQAYAILGIVYSNYALENFESYITLMRGDADQRVQSAAGSLQSRANFDLRLDDGSYYLLTDFIAATFTGG